ncbi:MAG: NAD-dependent epimerase/dehydratase family protein [Thermodesulfobacteriota bacterium]
MQNILITGATGFIGSALCSRLASDNKVIGIHHKKKPINPLNIIWEQADLTDVNAVAVICKKHSPDIVIHCAGIAHQKIGLVDSASYARVNSEATENLARAAAQVNPDVRFIFLSSVSVYGEGAQINPQITQITQSEKDALRKGACLPFRHRQAKAQKREDCNGIGEDGECQPSSDYARSKLDAERRLMALADEGILNDLIILRLAPVYDREWSFNLDRRILAPLHMAYIRFGSGRQKMSALARPNLVDFIEFLIHRLHRFPQIKSTNYADSRRLNPQACANENNLCNRRNLRINIFNVCDTEPYEFNTIIQVFKNSGAHPNRPVIPVPLPVVWLATRIAGGLLPSKRKWWHSCYDKLASGLVFDNEKMLQTGFRPRHSLETIFQSADYAD